MDTLSAPELAVEVGVSLPRLHRALDRLGVPGAPGPGRARVVPASARRAIVQRIGSVPQRRSGLSREGVLVAKVLSYAPFGVSSARALGRLAGVSPTTAAKILRDLHERGWAEPRTRTVAAGGAVEMTVWVARGLATWPAALLADIKAAALPSTPISSGDRSRVPARFHHLFWNVDVRALRLPDDAAFVAARLLAAHDAGALSWAVTELPYEALERALSSRTFGPGDQWLLEAAKAA